MGYKNAILHEPLLKIGTINCLTYEENTRQPYNNNLCLFLALALRLHGTQRLEGKTSKLFSLLINKLDGLSGNQFQGVHAKDVRIVEVLPTLKILLYATDFVDGNNVGELTRRNVQKYENIANAETQPPHMLPEHY